MTDAPEMPRPVRALAQPRAHPRPMRRGSLSIRSMTCTKASCRWAPRAEARHGPYARVVRVVAGRTPSRPVPPATVEVVRRQIEAGPPFRQQVEAYGQACARGADAERDVAEAASREAAQQGASTKPSRPRATPRSTRGSVRARPRGSSARRSRRPRVGRRCGWPPARSRGGSLPIAPTTRPPSDDAGVGQRPATPGGGPRRSRRCSTRDARTPRRTRRPERVSTLSRPTASGCAPPSSGPRGGVPPPESSRPAARWPSARASSARGCTGPCEGPTP